MKLMAKLFFGTLRNLCRPIFGERMGRAVMDTNKTCSGCGKQAAIARNMQELSFKPSLR